VAEIQLTKGAVALVDDEDVPLVSGILWHLHSSAGHKYAQGHIGSSRRDRKHLLMHRLIMKPEPGRQIDHVNGNGLDNRRCNLRLCNVVENGGNKRKTTNATTSRFKGVSKCPKSGKWVAAIKFNRSRTYLGRHESEEVAARAYDAAARNLFGEFARVNFPDKAEQGAVL